MQKYQYAVVSEPEKGRFYPVWRTKDGKAWKFFLNDDGKKIYFKAKSEALQFIQATRQ